jgi:hypothetical protein
MSERRQCDKTRDNCHENRERNTMKKSEIKAVESLETMMKLGGYEQNVAQGLSALIRAAMTDKSRRDLLALAEAWNMGSNPHFII